MLTKPDLQQWIHRAIVVDNVDPKSIGRLKLICPEVMVDEKENLPWVYPITYYELGFQWSSSEPFKVPEIDNEVTLIYPFKSVYFPFYHAFYRSHDRDPLLKKAKDDPEGFRKKLNDQLDGVQFTKMDKDTVLS